MDNQVYRIMYENLSEMKRENIKKEKQLKAEYRALVKLHELRETNSLEDVECIHLSDYIDIIHEDTKFINRLLRILIEKVDKEEPLIDEDEE